MDRLSGITMRIGTGWRYLNIDEDGTEIGHIKLSTSNRKDQPSVTVGAKYVEDRAWISKIAEFCQLGILAAHHLPSPVEPSEQQRDDV